jgi:hypothetical protein
MDFLGVGYGMEMDLYKSQISDGVLVQTRNRTSRCLKSHASGSHFFGTKRTHFQVPGLKKETLFSKLLFFGMSADRRLVQICILICILQIHKGVIICKFVFLSDHLCMNSYV